MTTTVHGRTANTFMSRAKPVDPTRSTLGNSAPVRSAVWAERDFECPYTIQFKQTVASEISLKLCNTHFDHGELQHASSSGCANNQLAYCRVPILLLLLSTTRYIATSFVYDSSLLKTLRKPCVFSRMSRTQPVWTVVITSLTDVNIRKIDINHYAQVRVRRRRWVFRDVTIVSKTSTFYPIRSSSHWVMFPKTFKALLVVRMQTAIGDGWYYVRWTGLDEARLGGFDWDNHLHSTHELTSLPRPTRILTFCCCSSPITYLVHHERREGAAQVELSSSQALWHVQGTHPNALRDLISRHLSNACTMISCSKSNTQIIKALLVGSPSSMYGPGAPQSLDRLWFGPVEGRAHKCDAGMARLKTVKLEGYNGYVPNALKAPGILDVVKIWSGTACWGGLIVCGRRWTTPIRRYMSVVFFRVSLSWLPLLGLRS